MSTHRQSSKNSVSPDNVRQKTSAVLSIRRERRVTGPRNGVRFTIPALEKAALALADARYNLGFSVGKRGVAPAYLTQREAVAANRVREIAAGLRAWLRTVEGGS